MNTSSSPRLAVIGYGPVVAHHLLPALRRNSWQPNVVADPSSECREVVVRKMEHKGRRMACVADWRTALSEFDAAVIAAPSVLQGEIGLDLLRAGKHVFMAEPLAVSAGACRDMIAAAAERQLILSVGLFRRYLHVARWTKALLASGALGDVRSFSAREGFALNSDTNSDALILRESTGGGVLLDLGAHTLDLILWWLGHASALQYHDDSRGGVEADCTLTCTMESGAEGSIELSRSRNLRNSLRIDGTRGFVEVHLQQNKVLAGSPHILAFMHGGFTAESMPVQRVTELLNAELRDFKASVVTGDPQGVPGTEGIRSAELIEKCYSVRKSLIMPWMLPNASPAPDESLRPSLPAGSLAVITGGSGFIGGRLAEQLVTQGIQVRCLVRNLGNCGRLSRLPVELVKADLTDRQAVAKATEGAGFVFHCAYDTRSRRQNIEGTRNLLAAAIEKKVGRFVHVSTFSVYEPFPNGELTEQTRNGDPSWIYVRNKLDLEREVLQRAHDRTLATTVVQPSIVYGPFSKPWTNAPAEMLLYGDVILPDRGEGICNAVYIDDLVDGLIIAAVHPAAVGERFIMSGPNPVTWADFFEAFAKAVGAKSPVYWPAAKIAKENQGVGRDVRLVLKNPKRIVQVLARWDPARRALQSGLDTLPSIIRSRVGKYYFGSGERKLGDVSLPSPQLLRLYTSRGLATSQKARQMLGFNPRYGFRTGMDLTARYLGWAYGDLGRSLRGLGDGAELGGVNPAMEAASVVP